MVVKEGAGTQLPAPGQRGTSRLIQAPRSTGQYSHTPPAPSPERKADEDSLIGVQKLMLCSATSPKRRGPIPKHDVPEAAEATTTRVRLREDNVSPCNGEVTEMMNGFVTPMQRYKVSMRRRSISRSGRVASRGDAPDSRKLLLRDHSFPHFSARTFA